jgi:hypothetical protein
MKLAYRLSGDREELYKRIDEMQVSWSDIIKFVIWFTWLEQNQKKIDVFWVNIVIIWVFYGLVAYKQTIIFVC